MTIHLGWWAFWIAYFIGACFFARLMAFFLMDTPSGAWAVFWIISAFLLWPLFLAALIIIGIINFIFGG